MIVPREEKRYGKFKAKSDVGDVIISISIYGFAEKIEVWKNKKRIANIDTELDINGENDLYEETDDYLIINETSIDVLFEPIKIYKPFGKCLKRYND